jgi:DNA-binding response OmpR family regulator
MSSILIVEDDLIIGGSLQAGLVAQRYSVDWAKTGSEAIALTSRGLYDLILLDLGLPDVDGVEVCRRVRVSQAASVIVILTARDEEIDVVVGLEAGGDDYLTKPFRLTELLARVRAHMRRATAVPMTPKWLLGELLVDVSSRRAWVGGAELSLRTKEFDLLARLASEPNVAVTRETLMADVWDENWFGSTKTLDVHIAAVRRKLAAAAGQRTPQIVTLRGVGFRLDVPVPGD